MKGEILRCPYCFNPVKMQYDFTENKYFIACKGHITVMKCKLGEAIRIFKDFSKSNTEWHIVNSTADLECGRGRKVLIMYDDMTTDTAWIGDNLNLSKDFIEIDIKKVCGFKFI